MSFTRNLSQPATERQLRQLLTSKPAQWNAAEGQWAGRASHAGKTTTVEMCVSRTLYETPVVMSWPELGHIHLPCTIELEAEVYVVRLLNSQGKTLELRGRLEGDELVGELVTNWPRGPLIQAEFQLERKGPAAPRCIEEEVSFVSPGAELSGTMVFPTTPGPHPTMVWIHGSGGMSRRYSSYVSLAYFLAEHGFASLIYDKRGVGESTGDWRTADFFDLADDAGAGVEFVKAHPNVDARCVGLGTVSQGGWIAPIVASRTKGVAAIVSISPPGTTSAEQTIYFIEGEMRYRGASANEIRIASSLQRRVHEFVRSGEGHDALQAELDIVKSASWFSWTYLPEVLAEEPDLMSILDFDPLPWWRQMRMPILAMWGAADTIVPPHRSRQAIEGALEDGGNHRATCTTFERSGHTLKLVRQPGDGWDWPREHADYIPTLLTWLREHLNRD